MFFCMMITLILASITSFILLNLRITNKPNQSKTATISSETLYYFYFIYFIIIIIIIIKHTLTSFNTDFRA